MNLPPVETFNEDQKSFLYRIIREAKDNSTVIHTLLDIIAMLFSQQPPQERLGSDLTQKIDVVLAAKIWLMIDAAKERCPYPPQDIPSHSSAAEAQAYGDRLSSFYRTKPQPFGRADGRPSLGDC